MTVKLVLLKTGETLISDVKEGFYEDKLVCYILEKPFYPILNETNTKDKVPYFTINTFEVIDNKKENTYSVELFPWPILSKDDIVEIPHDCVLTLTNPIEKIEKLYTKKVLKNGNEINKNTSDGEQFDPDKSD